VKNADILAFRKTVLGFYRTHGRHDLPWRKTRDPYRILVSEVMLQQTQVERVIPKYKAFLARFPDIVSLSEADLGDVLALWSGLGYNRRALYLKRAAEAVVADYGGVFPKEAETLEKLPGIGPYTARAVATFSHDAPYIFIETNIRRVFIHAFFPHAKKVPDAKLFPLIEAALPKAGSPKGSFREWYSALMDYGTHLKATMPNPNKRSSHYTKQSAFRGSVRELRGEFLRIATRGIITKKSLLASYQKEDKERAEKALAGLVKDGILSVDIKGRVTIKR
jgi:A/G-specific adenine glycosylase